MSRGARLLVVAFGMTAAVIAPRAQVFRTAADAVRVDVLVTSGNKPIGGLTTADFALTDNGVAQAIDLVAVEEIPFSMLLALDTSESMAGSPLADLKSAATAAVNAMRAGDRAAVVTFSEELRQRASWLPAGSGLTQAIENVRASGSTALFDAAFAALTLRDPEPGRRALVLFFSDGDDTSSWLPASAALDKTARSDAVVYSVSLRAATRRDADLDRGGSTTRSPFAPGRTADAVAQRRLALRSGITLSSGAPVLEQSAFLPDLAQRTGGQSIEAETSGRLREAFERIVTEFRSRYLLSYTPRGVDAPGWHRLQVAVKGRRATVTARRGYTR